MSLTEEILNLLARVANPAIRVDVNATIRFLREMFEIGRIKEEELRAELRTICMDVLFYSCPELSEEEIRNKAEEYTEKLMREIKLENVTRRLMRRITLEM